MNLILKGKIRNNLNLEKIFSSLVPCDLNLLKSQMEERPDLKKILTTKGIDLPEQYRYLISEELSDWQNATLYDLITTFHGQKGEKLISNFSTAGEKIVGWVGYIVGKNNFDEEIVLNIKMFSFDLSRPNPIILKDLRDLIYDLQNDYPEVRWLALKDNPANKIYRKFLDEIGGETIDFGNKWMYRV